MNPHRFSWGIVSLLVFGVLLAVPTTMGSHESLDVAPDSEEITLGTSAGFTNLALDDAANWVGTEGASSSTDNTAPATATKTKGTLIGGTEPTCWESSDDVRCTYQEADQAVITILLADTETLTKANSVSGALSDLNTDNGVSRVVSEANQGGAATISFVGNCENSAANGADVTLTLPSLLTDDLIIIAYAIGDNDGVNFNMAMITAGYTEVADLFADDTQDTNLGVYWKIANGDTSATVDGQGGTDAAVAAVCMVFRNVDTTTPMDVTPTTATGINTMHPDPPSIDYTSSGVWTVIAGASGHTLLGAGTYTFPTGYTTNAIDRGQDDTSDTTVGAGYRTTPADPENPGIMTHSGTDSISFSWNAATLALRPGTVLDYELEYRLAFTSETCADTRRLTVNAWRSNGNMENVDVQVLDSTETTYTTRMTVSQTTDTATQTYDLTADEWDAGDVQIRMLGTTEAGDTLQGQFSMDYVVIQCVPALDYELQIDFDWNLPTTTGTEFRLFVEGREGAVNPEQMDIFIYGSDEISVTNPCAITSTTESEIDCGTLTMDQLDAGDVDISIWDLTQSGDTLQSTVDIDRIRIQRTFNYYRLTQAHKWVTTLTAGDAYQLRVSALRSDTEDFAVQVYDWTAVAWNTRITINVASETLFTYTMVGTTERAANGTAMTRILGLSETTADETSSTVTMDLEVIRITVTDEIGGGGGGGGGSIGANPAKFVTNSCSIRWPLQILRCETHILAGWAENAGGITRIEWYVDGAFAQNGSILEISIPEGWWEPALISHDVHYRVYTLGGATAISKEHPVTVDQRFLILVPIAIVFLALAKGVHRYRMRITWERVPP